MSSKTTVFDPADYLTDRATIAAYLAEALEHEDTRGLVDALQDVVRARGGRARMAAETGLSESVLDAALGSEGPVDFDAVRKVLFVLGVRLSPSLVA